MNNDDERDFLEERANEAPIRAALDDAVGAVRRRRRALYDSILADRQLDRGVELDEDPDRFLLVERSTINGDAWPSTFGTVEEALRYHDEQEYPADWDILALFDLDTEDGREIFTRTRTTVDLSEECEERWTVPAGLLDGEPVVANVALGGYDGVVVRFGDGTDGDTWESVFGYVREHSFTLGLTFRTKREDESFLIEKVDAEVAEWNDFSVLKTHGEVVYRLVVDGEAVGDPVRRPTDSLVGIEVY